MPKSTTTELSWPLAHEHLVPLEGPGPFVEERLLARSCQSVTGGWATQHPKIWKFLGHWRSLSQRVGHTKKVNEITKQHRKLHYQRSAGLAVPSMLWRDKERLDQCFNTCNEVKRFFSPSIVGASGQLLQTSLGNPTCSKVGFHTCP